MRAVSVVVINDDLYYGQYSSRQPAGFEQSVRRRSKVQILSLGSCAGTLRHNSRFAITYASSSIYRDTVTLFWAKLRRTNRRPITLIASSPRQNSIKDNKS